MITQCQYHAHYPKTKFQKVTCVFFSNLIHVNDRIRKQTSPKVALSVVLDYVSLIPFRKGLSLYEAQNESYFHCRICAMCNFHHEGVVSYQGQGLTRRGLVARESCQSWGAAPLPLIPGCRALTRQKMQVRPKGINPPGAFLVINVIVRSVCPSVQSCLSDGHAL